MTTIPVSLVALLQSLPEKQPLRLILHTNGEGVWKVEEVRIFHAAGPALPAVVLASLSKENALTKVKG